MDTLRKLEHVRRNRCPDKRQYQNWDEAEEAALILIEDLRDGKLRMQKGTGVYAYKCDYCDGWHIGHTVRPSNPWNHWYSSMKRGQLREAFTSKPGG